MARPTVALPDPVESSRSIDPTGSRPVGIALIASFGFLVTWLQLGYRYGPWPQPADLQYVLRFNGFLDGDWATGLPPSHWAFTHLLALFPWDWMSVVFAAGWVAGLLILWASFGAIGRSLGAGWITIAIAILLGNLTRFDGLGGSVVLLDLLYPNALAFSLALGSIAAFLRRSVVLGGALLGTAALLHPGIGILTIATIVPVALWTVRAPLRRWAMSFAIMTAVAAPGLFHLWFDQAAEGGLTAAQRFDLLKIRIPHHMLYADFPKTEYAHTAVWAAVAFVALRLLRPTVEVSFIRRLLYVVAGFCFVGGVASTVGKPLVLVQAQTARITPMIILFGVIAAATALQQRVGSPAPRYVAAVILTSLVAGYIAPDLASVQTMASSCAGLILLALLLMTLRADPFPIRTDRSRRPSTASIVVLGGLCVAALAGLSKPAPSAEEQAWEDIASRARQISEPSNLFMTPPDMSGFSTYAQRPTVIDFGILRFGKGDLEWVERMQDVTGDPLIVSSELQTDLNGRLSRMREGYGNTLQTSQEPMCEYDPEYAVGRKPIDPPEWLVPRAANDYFVLFEVEKAVVSCT